MKMTGKRRAGRCDGYSPVRATLAGCSAIAINKRRAGHIALLIALLTIATSGCVSSPTPISRYNLPFGDSRNMALMDTPKHTVALPPIEIARYLRQDGILMQLSDIELRHADNHLWAEPLERQLDRTLRHRLEQALADTRVLRGAAAASAPADYRLMVDIDRFQGRQDGKAVVSGEWAISDRGGVRVAHRLFVVEEPLESDGYPALVRSLGRAWEQAVNEMIGVLEKRLGQAPSPGPSKS